MPNKEDSKFSDIHSNDSLPVLHIDSAFIGLRDDKMNFLSFITNLPSGNFEQARIMIRDDDLYELIDDMCNALNYYPKKPSGKRSSLKK